MTLRTIGSLIGAANGAIDLQSMAASFFVEFRKHANGVGGVTVPSESFVVAPCGVAGTADCPKLKFALVWTEHTTWQVTDYLSPDDDGFSEAWGSDNSCGYHIESEDRQRECRITIDAAVLLLPIERQVAHLKRWKAAEDAKKQEQERVARVAALEKELTRLKGPQ